MTTPADIVERLRRRRMGPKDDLMIPPVNPDGPEAADTIEKHRAAIEASDANVKRYAQVLAESEGLNWAKLSSMGRCSSWLGLARAILAALNEAVGG